MNEKRLALQILANRKLSLANKKKYSIASSTHEKQFKFVNDNSSQVIACCSRRAGKTEGIAHNLVNSVLLNRGQANVYVTLNRLSGIRIIWRTIKSILDAYEIRCDDRLSAGEILVNGDTPIYVGGAKDLSAIEVYRGNKYKIAIIDEAQSFRNSIIKQLVEDVFTYATIDYKGSIKLTGTPPPSCSGYFYDCWHGLAGEWSKHYFTMKDNSYLLNMVGKSYEELVAQILKQRNCTIEDSSFRREFLGEWVKEFDSMIYKLSDSLNCVDEYEIPKALNKFVMGIDIGFDDSDAIVVWGFNPNISKNAYAVYEWKKSQCDITSLANKIHEVRSMFPISKMVMDTGGLGKKILEELRNRHKLSGIEPASKSDKYGFIEVFNDNLRQGFIKIPRNSEYRDELSLLRKDDSGKEDGDFDNHLCDAGLYGYREAYAYIYKKEWEPAHGTSEYYDHLEKVMIDNETQKELRKNNDEYTIAEERLFDD